MTGPSGIERVKDEVEIAASQAQRGRPGLRLMAYHDQPAGDVVDAVAMFASGNRVTCMLEEPALVSEAFEVIEHRLVDDARGRPAAGGHAAALAAISWHASSRY
jgi:hypothetical protein